MARSENQTRHWLSTALTCLRQGQSLVSTIVVDATDPTHLGLRALYTTDHHGVWSFVGDGRLRGRISEVVLEDIRLHRAARMIPLGDETELTFVSSIGPPEETWVFGAGHIAQSLVPLLKRLGWRVIVCDDRAQYVTEDRFPEADDRRCSDFAASALECAARDLPWVILVTRGHEHDELILSRLGRTRTRYIGMIGSRRRVKAVRDRLTRQGMTTEFLDQLHAPIGIPIGADSPAEIAVSIVAEMVSVRRGAHSARPQRQVAGQITADTSGSLALWERIESIRQEGHPVVLATIVERRGSTPRGLGAQMAILADGAAFGTIGGGCGEEDIRRAAKRMLLGNQPPQSVVVDLTGDPTSESTADVCGGRYVVFLERL